MSGDAPLYDQAQGERIRASVEEAAAKLREYARESREWWRGSYRVGSLSYPAVTCRLSNKLIAVGFSIPSAPSFIFVTKEEAPTVFSIAEKCDALTCLSLDRRLRTFVEQEIRERRV